MKKRILVLSLFVATILSVGAIAFAAPGDASDPLITLSYLESTVKPALVSEISASAKETILAELNVRIAELEAKQSANETALYEKLLAEMKTLLANSGSSATGTVTTDVSYTAILLENGKTVVAKSGSIEVILRRGVYTCVDPIGDNIVNITRGGEAANGNELTLQNCYLIPRADGRGIRAVGDNCWIMVRGSYEIVG